MNIILQNALNPAHRAKREYKFREKIFREGDRVMQTRNNYDLTWERTTDGKSGNGIFNGDIGIIEVVNPNSKIMKIDKWVNSFQ